MTAAWDWAFAWKILPQILQALIITVELTLAGTVGAMIVGLALELLRRSRLRVIRWSAKAFVEFVRDTPLLVQAYFIFFVLPDYQVILPVMLSGVIVLSINYSGYTAEVYRAGINSIPITQWEAARALNYTTVQTWASVILPQGTRAVIPPLGNYLIAMFKDTPILSSIGIIEMLGEAQLIGATHFRYLEPITLVGILFLALSYPSSIMVRRLEARFGTAPGDPRRRGWKRLWDRYRRTTLNA